MDELSELAELADDLTEHSKNNKLQAYVPYDFQKKFHFAKGEGDFVCAPSDKNKKGLATRRGLMCANQIGKTFTGGSELAFHATGIYPEKGQYFYPEYWPNDHGIMVKCPYEGQDIYPNGWEGHRFDKPTEWIAASTTNETTRDRCQKELLGNPTDKESLGTGSIPKERIGKLTRKAGVPDAYETVLVKHISGGWSKINFKCYEQGKKKFMGYVLSGGYWCDEEPPSDIISQLNRGTTATNGIGYITFTPEEGITDVVYEYLESEKPGYGLITATWDDAPHMTPETRAQKLADYPPHEQKMRSEGKPMVGTGLIFPVPDEEIACEPFELPHHWPRIIGFDIGDDHPCGIVCAAVDRDTDSFYIYRVWRQSRALIPVIADVLKQCHGDWIPIAWPHDGMKRDTQSGRVIADIYRDDHGLNFHHERFSNPPGPGQKEGQGGQGVEAGLHAMFNAMIEGRFKVFITCTEFFDEKRMYHRKDNQVVKVKDDIMSASRYAYMMQRHAITKPTVQRIQTTKMKGLSNW